MRTDDHSVRQLVDDLSSAALRDLLRNVRHHTELRRQIASGLVDERMVNDAYREYARREGAAYRQHVADITVQYYSDLADLGNRYSEAFYADVLGGLGENGDGHRESGPDGRGGHLRRNGPGSVRPNAASPPGPDVEEVPIELHAPPGKEVMASFELENTDSRAAELSIEVGSCQGPDGDSFMAPLTVQPAQFVLEPAARRSITLRLVMLPTVFVPGHLYRLRVRIVGPSELVLLVTIWAEEPDAPTVPASTPVAEKPAPGDTASKTSTPDKLAGKKPPAKQAAATKSPATKSPAKKPAANKPAANKPAGKEPPAKKSPAKKAVAKKSPAKKAVAKKSPAKKVAAKKPSVRKSAAKKSPAKKVAAKKPSVRKSAAKKPPAKKVAAKKPSVRKSAAKKSPAKKVAAKKPSVRKSAAKNPPAKKVAAKKPSVRKSAAKNPPAKKVAAKKPSVRKSAAKKPPAKKVAAKKPSVRKSPAKEASAERAQGAGAS